MGGSLLKKRERGQKADYIPRLCEIIEKGSRVGTGTGGCVKGNGSRKEKEERGLVGTGETKRIRSSRRLAFGGDKGGRKRARIRKESKCAVEMRIEEDMWPREALKGGM